MFTPAATAAWIASCPEWKKVPSPRFWMKWSRLDEGRHADPLGALVAHAGEAGDVADAFGIHQQRHRVAADPRADQRAVGDFGAAVVRTARAEEGRPLDRHGISPSRRRSRASRSPRRAPRRRRSTGISVSASSAPCIGTSARPRSSCLPTIRGRSAVPYSASLTSDSRFGAFSSITKTSSSPERSPAPSPGRTASACPSSAAGCRRSPPRRHPQPEPRERLAHLAVGDARRHDADPCPGASTVTSFSRFAEA